MAYQEYQVVKSTWVRPEDRDTAWWVTRKLYPCRIPYIQTLSPDYIKFMGMPDSGDEHVNLQMRNELIDVQISIGKMATYYADDVQVHVPNPKTTKEIYERVHEHLQAWKQDMEQSVNPGQVPIDDLLKLDQFAAAVYPYAKRFFDKEFVESKFARRLSGLVSISRSSFMEKLQPKRPTVDNQEPDVRKHESFADIFLERKNFTAGRRWK